MRPRFGLIISTILLALLTVCVSLETGYAEDISLHMLMSHHLYEDGDDYNRLYFEVLDANGDYPVENTLNSIKLFAPDGAEITLDTSDWDTASLFYGQYNATTGNYEYASESVISSYYECRFSDPMPIGEYHLEVIDTEGATHHSYREYDGAATLPMISSDTFRFSLNPDGDFLWTWQAPTGIDPGLETETRAKIKVFENGEAVEEIYVSSIPTDLGELLLPASIVNAMEARGDRFECTLSLRTTNSQNRTITKAVPLNSLSNPPRYTVSGTVAVDGYTGGDIFLKLYDGQIPNQSILLAEAVISEPGSFSLGPLPDMGGINTWFYVVWDQNENGSVGLGDKYGATAFQLYDDFVVPNVPLNDTIDFSVTGGVKNVHEPDGSYSTLLEVEVTDLGSLFGTIPDDIDAVVFEGPSGVLATSGMEFEQYSDDNGWYWIFLPDQ